MRRSLLVTAALYKQYGEMSTATVKIANLKDWKFKNPPSYAKLPIDDNPEYNVPVAVKNAVFSKVPTEPLTGKLHLVCASEEALTDILDLDPKVAETEEFIDFVAGKYDVQGGLTVCHRYGGYQFGFWSDQLGDGRAHVLGEYVNSKGESWQPQLKGSGETPYSRFGDGRAVLRSSVREMIASEACYHLGVPTTRAGALVVSDEHKVWRDKTYSGHARAERAAVLLRLAPAWYRLGSLEILHRRHETHLLRRLADFILEHHFPHISGDDKYVQWFRDVAHRNLDMVATWQGVGFTHGVLNTDNISVLGLTVDYGPYGFLDHYYEGYVPNSSDDMGRYAFDKQPQIVIWNLEKFAEALSPVLSEEQAARVTGIIAGLEEYVGDKILQTYLLKLGVADSREGDTREGDSREGDSREGDTREGDTRLVGELMTMMQQTTADFTATFRQLAEVEIDDLNDGSVLESKWSLAKICKAKDWDSWLGKYRQRLSDAGVSDEQRRAAMCRVNPVYVPRNWILQEAIADAENNDFTKVRLLLKIFEKPYESNEEAEKMAYSAQPPSWSYGLKLSCSS